MGKRKPTGEKGAANYDQDYDPEHTYHGEWKGLVYDKDVEDKMTRVMDTSMPDQAKLFATEKTYLYYTRYFAMLNRMDELRRENVLANINKKVEDPLVFRRRFEMGQKTFGIVNTTLATAGVAAMLVGLRFLRK